MTHHRTTLTAAACGLAALAMALQPTPASAQSWIAYKVTGTVAFDGREEEVVLCSETDEGLQIHTIGEWNFSLELAGSGAGTHEAKLMVAAPDSVSGLHDDNFRTGDRLTGRGTATVEAAGAGAMGLPLIRVTFAADSLGSDTGATIAVEGTLVCTKM